MGLPAAFSEIDDILGKVLELLSAANSTILSIFISSTRNDKYAAHYKTLQQNSIFEHLGDIATPFLPNNVKLSISKTAQTTAPTHTTLNWGAEGIGELLLNVVGIE